ncbi:MAG: hypothetical protein ABI083_05430 [Lapillicoccus sp.]
MHRFSATTTTTADVRAGRQAIWAALTDPQVLTTLTPLLHHIETDGDLWRWELTAIAILGVKVNPTFTERMHFTEEARIDYTHEPPAGTHEHAGADGWYTLHHSELGTRLGISLTLHVDLPLSRLTAPAVQQVMRSAMQVTGDRFGANLERHLGLR